MSESYAAGDAASSKLIAPGFPINSEFNYYYSKTTITRGPAFNSCNYGITQNDALFVPVYESFSYSDATSSYSKYVGYSSDNNVNNYSLSTSSQTDGKYKYNNIVYMGGQYAVRISGEYDNDIRPLSVSTDPGVSTEPMLKNEVAPDGSSDSVSSNATDTVTIQPVNYFGDTAEVLRTETIDGKEYYVVQTSYEANCAGYMNLNRWDNETAEDNRTMYILTYASTSDYQILKTENYIDSVSSSNLIDSTEFVNQNANVEFASVSSNFNFEFNVPLRDISIDYSSSTITYDADAEIQKSMDFIKSEDLSVLVPSQDVLNKYVYFNYNTKGSFVSQADSYYTDRDFYPAGAVGDAMFNEFNNVSSIYYSAPLALGSVSYSKDETSYTVSIYSADGNKKEILNSMLWSDIQNKSETETTVTINNTTVQATLYSYQIEQPSILPYVDYMEGAAPETCTENCFSKQYVLIFTYNNNIYSLVESSFSYPTVEAEYDPLTDGSFVSYSSTNSEDLIKIEELVTNSMKGTYVDGGGVIEPALPL